MKKMSTRMLSFFVCLSFLICSVGAGNASAITVEEWDSYYSGESIKSAQAMFPGSDESERNFSWYSALDAGNCWVEISENADLSEAVTFSGTWIQTPQGDRTNKVTATGLEEGTTYYYACCTDLGKSETRTFTTDEGDSFSAVYVTDIHISDESMQGTNAAGTDKCKDQAYYFNQTLEAALSNNDDISLLLSAGDQASSGYRNEYEGLASAPNTFGLTWGLVPGNHDLKNVNYRYFTNNPNESKDLYPKSYIASDYWFVKGDVLFLMMDSNCANTIAHRKFMKQAVELNPDVKWRVMMFHHELYGGRLPHRESDNALLRLIWTPLVDEFSVDLVLMGHSHYYSVSDVIYDNKSVQKTSQNCTVTNPEGSIYMVSGSINRPREYKEDTPLGDKIGYAYLPEENDTIYNIIDFSEDSIKVSSYGVETGSCFNTITIEKTSQDGGHPDKCGDFYDPLVRFIGMIVALFGNIGVYSDLKKKMGIKLPFFDAILGR